MSSTHATIDEYITACPAEARDILEQVRRTARAAAPSVGERISYGIPTLSLDGRDLVSFAAWKKHIGLYPLPAMDDALATEVAPYRAAKSSLRFYLDQPIPYDLIARIVALHVRQRREAADGEGGAGREQADG